MSEDSWLPLATHFNVSVESIDEVLQRVEKLVSLATHFDEVQRLQILLSLTAGNFKDDAKLPCVILPVARNARPYDRDSIIERIDKHFKDDPEDERFRSLALYGLGGVGKSYVALKYSHGKTHEFQAILWIPSETIGALEQSFTNTALRLKLPDANQQNHDENRILVLDWLQRTSRIQVQTL